MKKSQKSDELYCGFEGTDETTILPISETFSEGNNFPYRSPVLPSSDAQFPIIAWGAFPEKFENILIDDDQVRRYCDYFKTIISSLKGCGFNAFIPFVKGGKWGPLATIIQAAYQAKGINPIPRDGNFHKLVKDVTLMTEMFEGKGGYGLKFKCSFLNAFMLQDEPSYADWGDVQFYFDNRGKKDFNAPNRYDGLVVGYKITRYLNPDKLLFFNLAVAEEEWSNGEWTIKKSEDLSGSNITGSCKTYPEYLDIIQELFLPEVWCYDVYPFLVKGDARENMTIENAGEFFPTASNTEIRFKHFYRSFENFSSQAAKTHRPFWAFCMSVAHGNWVKNDNGVKSFGWFQPAPTAEMLRFEAFNALAFGAQAILYFQFGSGIKDLETQNGQKAKEGTIFYDGILDAEPTGDPDDPMEFKITKIGEAATLVNSEIQSLAGVFLDAKLVDYAHVGVTDYTSKDGSRPFDGLRQIVFLDKVPEGESKDQFGPVRNIEFGSQENQYPGVLMSILKKGNLNILVIANHDPFHAKNGITLTVNSSHRYTLIWDNGKRVNSNLLLATDMDGNAKISISIPAGNFSIISYR